MTTGDSSWANYFSALLMTLLPHLYLLYKSVATPKDTAILQKEQIFTGVSTWQR